MQERTKETAAKILVAASNSIARDNYIQALAAKTGCHCNTAAVIINLLAMQKKIRVRDYGKKRIITHVDNSALREAREYLKIKEKEVPVTLLDF